MARNDSVGFFWDDTPPPKPPRAEKAKRTPPEAIWLRPDYLPGLEEARRFPVPVMTLEQLGEAMQKRDEFLVDVEVYVNYFLACFTNVRTGAVTFVEMYEGKALDIRMLLWLLTTFTTVGFNSLNYDLTMCSLAVAGLSTADIKRASDQIILEEVRGGDILRSLKVKMVKCDHIDLIEVAPLFASLKTYAGRMHAKKMQDLPFHPSTRLSADQITITRWYCVNDCQNTGQLRECLREHIDLRYQLSNEYQVDLRSKSDAQIAEAVMVAELQRRTGKRPQKPEIEVGTTYRYNVPHFIQFRTPLMNWATNVIRNARFVVDYTGSIAMPEEIKALNLQIAGSLYRMGIGGLHSSESTVAHYTDKDYILIDKDVTSFYPFIIMNQGLFPPHLGPVFLDVYRSIVTRRIAAKERGDKVIADSLKIVINGSFGKFGSMYSVLYAPNFLIQTTITGQLSILMLIERLELAGINVVSANTDGIVIKCPRAGHALFNSIVAQWEHDTNFKTEETRYLALYSRDVNNYIAVKQKEVRNPDGSIGWLEEPAGTKTKGAYANPWASKKNLAERLHKNPTTTICVEAVEAFLTKGTPIDHTIRSSTDITKFVSVRSVKGGAVKVWGYTPPPPHETREDLLRIAGFTQFDSQYWIVPGQQSGLPVGSAYQMAKDMLAKPMNTEYLGKSIRWYYGKNVPGELVYATSGNKVPRSDGAMPCMVLPDTFPDDVDLDWYINESVKILQQIAAII